MQSFGIWMRPTIQLHRHRFEDNMAAKARMHWSSFTVFVLTGAMFEMATVASSWARHYVPILGPTNPPSSRRSWNPHPVRQSKLDYLFTYLPSRRGVPSNHLVDAHIMAAWGIMACAMYRCFELILQFMHDHDDLQWLSHGSSMACSQNIWQNMARAAMGRIHMHHTRNNVRIHANHIREYLS